MQRDLQQQDTSNLGRKVAISSHPVRHRINSSSYTWDITSPRRILLALDLTFGPSFSPSALFMYIFYCNAGLSLSIFRLNPAHQLRYCVQSFIAKAWKQKVGGV
jgi:hypothetical protein